MGLPTPPEPQDIKSFIREQRKQWGNIPDIDCDALAVWAFNKLPSYLWRHWKQHLEPRGYTWQKFLKVLRYVTNDIIEWALYDRITWNELISKIVHVLERYSVR